MHIGSRARVRRATPHIVITAVLAMAATQTPAQAARDTVTRGDSARRLESVLVRAIRAESVAPIAQKTIGRAQLEQRHFAQDVPLLLQGASPSITAHTETGTSWGYSYLRLRGMDQTRINITIDGVPLNDPEDQVLYFANFADLLSGVQSVQVQRGVGTSSAGTASFAGSINLETMPVARANAGGSLSLQAGSFGAQRVSGAFHSGLTDSRLAVYGRAGALRTNGYRRHSGVEGRSAFLGAGWFGDRDIVKVSGLAGWLADTLSYVGATDAELRADRRYNPLDPDERDRFAQQMVALTWTRIASPLTSVSTTVYRNSAAGSYDYFALPDRYRYNLQHWWYGATSAVNVQRNAWTVNVGVNANTYERSHRAYLQPSTQFYDNTGHKDDASVFAKVSWAVGTFRWFGDVQGRWARFHYEPDAAAGIDERSKAWSFLNPKAGVTWQVRPGVSVFASLGITSREPARSDLFAGEDDLNASNVADYGDFSRVRPESVRDLEVGVAWSRAGFDVAANGYSMDFRDDIARIGAPTASGAILRRNVGRSYRRGVEVDWTWRGVAPVSIAGSFTWSRNRIRSFTDSSSGSAVERHNVEPLLTPQLIAAQQLEWHAAAWITLGLEGRYQSGAWLDNANRTDRRLPAFGVVDGFARLSRSRYALTLRGGNLGDRQGYGSGSVSGDGTVRYFVLPARALHLAADVTW